MEYDVPDGHVVAQPGYAVDQLRGVGAPTPHHRDLHRAVLFADPSAAKIRSIISRRPSVTAPASTAPDPSCEAATRGRNGESVASGRAEHGQVTPGTSVRADFRVEPSDLPDHLPRAGLAS
jgi:hypothetical protein